jgi:exosortase/archaeosortase family protein
MKYVNLLLRYIILALLAFNNLYLFYAILTPITVYSSYFLIKLVLPVTINNITIASNNESIMLVKACIAGSAFYLLTILNLTTPMPLKKRILSLLFSYLSLFILNVLRIFIVAALFFNNSTFFDVSHKLFWYLLSIIFVILIWFASAYLFQIKSIPVYSDFLALKQLYKAKTDKKN